MAKPTSTFTWATGGTAEVGEPTSGQKAIGYMAGYTFPSRWINWLMNTIGAWVTYLNGIFEDGSGNGIVVTGLSIGDGAHFTGGPGGANGVHGYGTGAGGGVVGTGGSTSGQGGTFTGGAPGGPGVGAYGHSSAGTGVIAYGGATGGVGVDALGGTTGTGVLGTGGTSSAAGVTGIGGAATVGNGGAGLDGQGTAHGAGARLTAGSSGGPNLVLVARSGDASGAGLEQGAIWFDGTDVKVYIGTTIYKLARTT